MAKKLPALVIVVAVLQIVFGSLGLFGPILYFAGAQKAFSSWQSSMPKAPGAPDFNQAKLEEELTRRLPWYPTFVLAAELTTLLLCVMMLAGGIGLFKLQKWAWWLTVLYAPLSIAYTITYFVIMATSVGPVMADVMAEMMRQALAQNPRGGGGGPDPEAFINMMRSIMTISTFAPVIVLVYPITILILILQRSARAACLGGRPDQDADRGRAGPPGEGEVADRWNAPAEPDDRYPEE
jgi:hypothetical protein